MSGTTSGAPKRSLFKLLAELPTLLVDLFRAELDSLKQEIATKLKGGMGQNRVYGSLLHTWRSTVQLPGIQDGKQRPTRRTLWDRFPQRPLAPMRHVEQRILIPPHQR